MLLIVPAPLLLALILATPAAAAPSRAAASAAPETAPLPPIVLVMPFTPIGDVDPDWLSAGVSEFLAEGLEAAGYRTVDTDARDEAMDDVGLAEEPRVTLASACGIARRLGARHVVTGSWRSEGSRLTFQARMIDVRRMKQVRTGSASGHVSTLGSLLGKLVIDIAGDGARQPVARQEIEALSTTRQEALMSWMQAAAEPESAVALLGSALQARSDFVPAILDLAEASLDAGKPEGVPKLLAALPPAVPPHQRSRQRLLEGRALLALGDHDGAVRALRDAVKDRPQPDWLMWLAEAQLAASDKDAARETAHRVLAVLPEDAHAHELLDRIDDQAEGAPAVP